MSKLHNFLSKDRFTILEVLAIYGIIIAVSLSLYVVSLAFGAAPASGSTDVPAFDHSNCQYPDRWSNPKDGCDNSDPAVPECIKAAYMQASEQACIDAFVKAHQTPEQTTTPVEATPTQSTGSTCK